MNQSPDQAVLSLLPVLLLFFFFSYFFVIRPQRKRQQKHFNLLNNLSIGDRILFSGGILAKIDKIDGDILDVVVSDNVIIQINKYSVSEVFSDGNNR